jgi:putative nucleotidyltransferase with HDIG domain
VAVKQRTTPRTRARTTTPDKVVAALPRPRVVVPVDEPDVPGRRWVARPLVARIVQVAVLAVPLAASLTTALLMSAALPRTSDLGTALLLWAAVVVTSTIVLFAVDRIARRALPLVVLLRLSLLFPDQAPRRYRLAAQSWSSRRLRERVEAARMAGETGAPIEAATQIIGLLASLSIHDRRTRGHCERVRAYNDLLAEELGLSQADRDRLRWAALIHDIGKLRVSPRLLNKPAAPTLDEWSVLRAHPLRGAEIAAPLAEWLGPWAAAIEQHHERWDGAGYPHGLQGTSISFGARIVAVADAFEVMTSTRPYSRPVDADAARTELAACAGTHFDPVVVRAFLNVSLGRLRKVMGPIAWVAQVPFLAGIPRLEAAIIGGGRQAAAGAGAAGAAAGVVAVTALAPTAAHDHARPRVLAVAAPAADTSDDASAVAPGAADFPAPAPAPTVSAHHHRAATPGHARSHHTSEDGTAHAGPGPAGKTAAGHHESAGHHRTSGHQQADGGTGQLLDPDTGIGRPAVTADDHGRCAGNRGAGIGNGGPQDPDRAGQLPAGPRNAAEHAPGLRACD